MLFIMNFVLVKVRKLEGILIGFQKKPTLICTRMGKIAMKKKLLVN